MSATGFLSEFQVFEKGVNFAV